MITKVLLIGSLVVAGVLGLRCGPATGTTSTAVSTRPPVASPTSAASPGPNGSPTTTATATPSARSVPELKYSLLDAFPEFFFCDPDYYPIAREDESKLALERFEAIRSDQVEFAAIVARLDVPADGLSDDQKLGVYREHKKLSALLLSTSSGGYGFDLRVSAEGSSGERVRGTISTAGTITIASREPAIVTCPICLARGTLIDTPAGQVPVEDLRAGQPIWTVDAAGITLATVVERVGATLAGPGHEIVTLTLGDGRTVTASPGHRLADGRAIGSLAVGDPVDGGTVTSVERARYEGGATYDLLPGGGTGLYRAGGILLESTLIDSTAK